MCLLGLLTCLCWGVCFSLVVGCFDWLFVVCVCFVGLFSRVRVCYIIIVFVDRVFA